MATDKPRLGGPTEYPDHYDPSLLVAITRTAARAKLDIPRPMYGVDVWTAYELSWLDAKGKPCLAVAEFMIPCDSEAIVESKSLKLYLNSLNQETFNNSSELSELIRRDLSAAFGGNAGITLFSLDEYGNRGIHGFEGICLDGQDVACDNYHLDSSVLEANEDEQPVSEILYSHLLKTNCPVTGQPDWASVQIAYRGTRLNRQGLLKYLVSFRQHQDFHEHCVERIFRDILHRCAPQRLSVYARYTRRGGLDINPFRSTEPEIPGFCRISRQ